MIGFLHGTLLEKEACSVLLEVNGVGYEIESPASTLCLLPKTGEKAKLHIYTHVREDAIRLFGFHESFDKKIFLTLMGVSGIGPKAALLLLGPMNGKELCHIIIDQRVDRLVAIPGIGQKTAERIVLELKSKMEKTLARANVFHSEGIFGEKTHRLEQTLDDLKSALANLGYKDKQYMPVVQKIEQQHQSGQDLSFAIAFKESLKQLSEYGSKNAR